MSFQANMKSADTKSSVTPASPTSSVREGVVSALPNEREVFSTDPDAVDFRTVTWQRLIIILLKVQIATGVLSIPSSLGALGAVPGALVIVGWQALNTCKSHSGCNINTKHGLPGTAYRYGMRSDRLPQQASPLP